MPAEIYEEVENCPEHLTEFLNSVVDACFEIEGVVNAGFTIRIVDADTIRELNRSQRGIDKETDVLSFPTVNYPSGKYARDCPKRIRREYDPSLGYSNLGDCVINLKRAEEQAAEFGHTLEREIGYLTAHSAFHLMGYDHMTDEDKMLMRAREKQAMEKLKLYRNVGE